jgi:PAS domain S-box-containing protein
MSAARTPRQMLAFLLTAAGALTLTFGAWYLARSDAEAEARSRFDVRAAEIVIAIKGRMQDYEQVLRGAAGLFAASESVERREWRAYVDAIQIERTYPGVRGLGYLPWLTPERKDEAERAARREGVADYAVFPAGERAGYAPVLYLEPADDSNRRALGFDMYTDPVRRPALERARDTGAAVVTPMLTLVQDAGAGPGAQPGFLMILPVYRNGVPAETIAERRAALAGYIYAPFRFADLVAGSIGAAPGFDLKLSDVTDAAAPAELFRSAPQERRRDAARFSRVDSFRVGQRTWRLDSASLPALEAEVASNRPPLVLASGLAISALLLLVVWSLSTTRERARELAQHMTVALRASEERLQLALASSQLALFDWDVGAGLVQLSAEWSVMLGGEAQPTLVPIQKLQLLDHPDDREAVAKTVRPLLRGEAETCRYEHRVRRADGSWLWIETVARVNERDAGGRALRITGANVNVDERKAVERLKSEFIATVSHELRTPLTSMIGSLGLVREGSTGELPPDAAKFIDIAYANSERLAALVNDILDMERIEAGRMEIQPERIETAALMQRAVELNAAYAARFGVRLEIAAAAAPAVLADPDRLMQVLTNLLSNAVKHSPAGAGVLLSAVDAGRAVRFSVADRGPGIAPEFRARLFGKFEQADRAHGGTGLGLAISKALAERMDGRIGCDSEPGQGSVFWVELPKA